MKENGVSTVTEYVWGNNGLAGMQTELAKINPCSYRGYDYDEETGYYYVASRYYNPEIGRFISEEPNVELGIFDHETGLHGYNIYSYCANDPIMYMDENGESVSLATCVVIGVISGAIVGAVASKLYYGKVNGWWVLGGAGIGGVVGYVGGAFFGASGIKAGTLAANIKMSKVRWLGKIGEQMAGWAKNTKRIDSLTGSANYRILDYLDFKKGIIGEVKNVQSQSFTNQLHDYMLYEERNGLTFVLKVRQSTKLSNTLKRYVDAGRIVISYIN